MIFIYGFLFIYMKISKNKDNLNQSFIGFSFISMKTSEQSFAEFEVSMNVGSKVMSLMPMIMNKKKWVMICIHYLQMIESISNSSPHIRVVLVII